MFRTLQHRLPKQLYLARIGEMEAANPYLQETYIPLHNSPFAVTPAEAGSAFIPGTACLATGRVRS